MAEALTNGGDPVQNMGRDNQELTTTDFLALFRCSLDRARFIGSADSEEWLTLVTYLATRPNSR